MNEDNPLLDKVFVVAPNDMLEKTRMIFAAITFVLGC
jgi:hypothetical protein